MTKISTLLFAATALLTIVSAPALADSMTAHKPATSAMTAAMAPHPAMKHAMASHKQAPQPAAKPASAMAAGHAMSSSGAMASHDSHM